MEERESRGVNLLKGNGCCWCVGGWGGLLTEKSINKLRSARFGPRIYNLQINATLKIIF